MTGLDGTPMPSFSDNIKPDEAWDLVFYLRTLRAIHTKAKETRPGRLSLKPGASEAPLTFGSAAIEARLSESMGRYQWKKWKRTNPHCSSHDLDAAGARDGSFVVDP